MTLEREMGEPMEWIVKSVLLCLLLSILAFALNRSAGPDEITLSGESFQVNHGLFYCEIEPMGDGSNGESLIH